MTDLLATTGSSGLVELAARATIVFFVALALQWLTRTGPSATRHHVWTLTFVLLLALPVLRLFGPSWDVPLFPQADGLSEEARFGELGHGVPAFFVAPAGTPASFVTDAAADRGIAKTAPPWRLTRLAFLLWGTGCAASLVSVGVGALRFRKLVRAGEPVENEAWLRQLEALRRLLAIRARVRLVLGTEAVTPMTGGLRRPVILLPASAANWTEARRHVVFAHELVHVRRRDVLRQLAGRVVLSFYWFHPLSWVASHLAAARREEACDDVVLAAGARPSEYARHLLSLAESRALGQAVLSLPMAQQSQLERRIRAILKPHRARPRALVTAVALTAVAVAGVSASVANPIRPGNSPGTMSGVDAVVSGQVGRVDCAAASDADRLSGGVFMQGFDDPFVCTIQGDAVTNDSREVHILGPDEWAVLGAEIRKQIAQHNVQGSTPTRKRNSHDRPERGGAGVHAVEAEVRSHSELSPR